MEGFDPIILIWTVRIWYESLLMIAFIWIPFVSFLSENIQEVLDEFEIFEGIKVFFVMQSCSLRKWS